MFGTASLLDREMTARHDLGIRPALDRISRVLEAMGNPQLAIGRAVHVAGTNGKGSVAASLEAIMRAAGMRTALYTSPHLIASTERLRFDGLDVDREAFDRSTAAVLDAEKRAEAQLTWFELATAAAFDLIARRGVDLSVIEVGLGGRWDATNVIAPVLSVLTPIGLDHQDLLGPDLFSIAREKLGILRPGVPCVCSRQVPEVEAEVRAWAERMGVPLQVEGPDFSAGGSPADWSFAGKALRLSGIRLALDGAYQVQNAAVAVAAAEMLWGGGLGGIAAAALGRVRWPGRFDLRRVQGCAVIFDGGHNPPAFEVLVPAFRERWAHQPVVLYAARPDKDVAKILARLEPLAAAFIFTRPGKSPGHAPADLARLVRKPALAVDSPDEAMSKLLAAVPPDEVRLCCGSLYLVGYYLEGLLGS